MKNENIYEPYKYAVVGDLDTSTKPQSTLDDFECALSNGVDSTSSKGYGTSGVEYLELESLIVSAANNKDHRRLLDILSTLIDERNAEQLDTIGALHWACYCGSLELVNVLLECGCDPHYPDDINMETPIYFAIKASNTAIVSLLIQKYGTSILCHENRKQMTPFLISASEFVEDNIIATLHILEYLYLSGVSLEEQDSFGRTALMHASRRGCLYVVQWLMSRGANLGHRDHLGNSVLHHACHGGNETVIRFLCKKGAIRLIDTKAIATTMKEETPLGICIMKQNYLQYTLLKMMLRNDVLTSSETSRRKTIQPTVFNFIYFQLWKLQYRVCGHMYSLRSLYPVYYWMISIMNLVLYCKIYGELLSLNSDIGLILDLWIVNWLISQCFWLSTFMSDPGIAKKTVIPSQINNISSSMEEDCMRGVVMKEGMYENMLSALERRQRLVNYEHYCINRDSYTMNYWFPHIEFENDSLTEPWSNYYDLQVGLDNPLENRVQICKDEYRNIQLEMNGIYNQLGVERQLALQYNYVDAIMNCQEQSNIKNVCVTCNMIKMNRTHHCGICGYCMKQQDHHCAWVDNCIARSNHRSFFIFVTSLSITIVHMYYLLYKYFGQRLVKLKFSLFWDLCLVLVGGLSNIVWFSFVAYLWSRTIRSMITDVTFYEFLKKPLYIRLRFNGNVNHKLWDFNGLGTKKCLNNIIKFWAIN